MRTRAFSHRIRPALGAVLLAALAGLPAGCGKGKSGGGSGSETRQGYVEGEYVYVASPLPGALETLSVARGAKVEAGAPLFALEQGAEEAARTLTAQRLEEGRALLADARKGKRPTEMASLEAQLAQSRSALALSEKEYQRQAGLSGSGASSAQTLDKAKAARDQDEQRIAQLEADLETAGLGAREDQIAAAEANLRALEAALAKAEWDLAQKAQAAPEAGVIFDTLYREGEWVAAGRPVVALLPPGQIKVRAFVPEAEIGAIQIGDAVRVRVDGVGDAFAGRVSFISPSAEYTPPVIYSQETRDKLVFMIEAEFEPEAAAQLHPGQPVDVDFEK
jgi:HlyD family secretion protein